jgi:hypothetical protein
MKEQPLVTGTYIFKGGVEKERKWKLQKKKKNRNLKNLLIP